MSPDSEPVPRVPWLPVTEGAQPATPPPPPLTPTKPTVPAWIQREPEPQPVDGDDGALVAPVAPPLADEVLPPLGVETTADEPQSQAPALWSTDPVHLLGESAVASAALSAAGAPTPLGGVPVVPATDAVTPPAFGDAAPLFTPRFEPVSPAEAAATLEPAAQTAPLEPAPLEPAAPAAPNAPAAELAAADFVAAEQARLAEQATRLDGGAAYTPLAFADDNPTEVLPVSPYDHATASDTLVLPVETEVPVEDTAIPAAIPPAPVEEPQEEPPRGRSKWWLWVLLAIVGVAAIATAIVLLNRPEPIVVPGTTVTLPPATPTIEPTPAPTGSDFQAAMPTEVGTYALVEAVPLDPADVALEAGRIADGVDLTYRSGTDTMTVRALQYYTVDEATEMFTVFAGEGTAMQPVEAGGVVVGQSAPITSPSPGIVWQNGTSLFILTGPTAQLADFQAQFGL